MNLIKVMSNPQKNGLKLHPAKVATVSTKATMMSLLYTVISKLSRVIRNQKHNSSNLKQVAARVSTPENPLVMESASDSTADYPDEEFTNETDGERATLDGREGQEDHPIDGNGFKESVGDHGDGGHGREDERQEPDGLKYEEGDE